MNQLDFKKTAVLLERHMGHTHLTTSLGEQDWEKALSIDSPTPAGLGLGITLEILISFL